jgi:hypothetical protein
MVALTIAAPVWAQCSVTAENDLNRQELNRLETTSAAPVAAAPMGYAPGEARPAAYYYPYYVIRIRTTMPGSAPCDTLIAKYPLSRTSGRQRRKPIRSNLTIIRVHNIRRVRSTPRRAPFARKRGSFPCAPAARVFMQNIFGLR